MCFHSKLHPNVKQNPFQKNRTQPTVNNDITAPRLHISRQPSVTKQNSGGHAENESQTPNKAAGRRERGRGGEGEQERGEERNANCEAVMEVTKKKKKKLWCLAFESITVVWLSSYHSPSVDAVSPISRKRVFMCTCVCVCVCDCDQCEVFFFLPYLVSPVSISPLNRCLCSPREL